MTNFKDMPISLKRLYVKHGVSAGNVFNDLQVMSKIDGIESKAILKRYADHYCTTKFLRDSLHDLIDNAKKGDWLCLWKSGRDVIGYSAIRDNNLYESYKGNNRKQYLGIFYLEAKLMSALNTKA